MPKVALADLKLDWGQLLAAAEPYRDDEKLKDEIAMLQSAHDRLQELSALRDELQAKRQRATQEMGEVKDQGKDAAIRVRSVLQGMLGPKNERLVQYGIAPRRPRRRQSSSTQKQSPPDSTSE
jgi:CHASE3 domain sensor protein